MSREKEIAQLRTTLSLDTGDFEKELKSVTKQTTGLKRSFDIANKAIENAEDKVEATTIAISKGEKAMDSMNKKLEMQKKRYNDLKSTVDNQANSYEKLSQELSEAEQELLKLESAENKNEKAIKNQEDAIKELREELAKKAQLLDTNINKLQAYSNNIDKTENDITGLGDQLSKLKNSLNEEPGNGGLDKLKDLASEAGMNLNLLELGAKGAALAIATVVTKKIIDSAVSYDKAITDLRITMGLTEESAKDLYNKINDISDGGYSIEGISNSVKILEQRFNLSADETKNLAQGMEILNKYGYENKDVVRFMTSAVNDWGMNYEEALDYILTGEQKGLNISEDWMDTLVEYTPILSTLGLTGQDVFALISEGVKATGLDTDKAADMVKEFFLTLTDGSTTSKDAFKELGINIDTLKNQIDNGSITSAEAMQKVMKAIMKVGDETEQARLLQEIFKGTIEYGSIGVVEAWANMEQGVVDTKGAIDEAKQAYEGSYEAMQQDLTQSWDELTQNIGSAVLPSLLDIVKALNTIPFHMELAGTQMSMSWDWVIAHLSNAWYGFNGVFQEVLISIMQAIESASRAMGMDEVAQSMSTNIDKMKGKHDELVEKIKTNEETINTNSDRLGKLWNETWSGNLAENRNTFRTIMGEIDSEAKKTNTNVSTSLDSTSKKISESTNKAKNEASNNFKGIKDSANTEMSGVKGAIDNNMDGSLKTVQVQATEMYKGVKTSFHKMSQSAREDGTEMYLGVQTSAKKMADSAKTSASDMYRGVTTSTSKMADKAINDWNRIKNAYSKSINGNVKITKTTVNKVEKRSLNDSIANYSIDNPSIPQVFDLKMPDISRYKIRGGVYTPSTIQNSDLINNNRDNETIKNLNTVIKLLKNQLTKTKSGDVIVKIENFNNNTDRDMDSLIDEIIFRIRRESVFE